MSRQIKDIKDKNTGLLVYPRTHISAVVISSDTTLEDSLEMSERINNIIKLDGDGNSYLANDGSYKNLDEYQKISQADAKYATITTVNDIDNRLEIIENEAITKEELNKGLSGKVDIIEGKLLSTEDFTSILKAKLESLNNYNDTEINEKVDDIQSLINTLVNKDANAAINTFNEIIAFLEGVENTENLDNIIASIEQLIAAINTALNNYLTKTDASSTYLAKNGKAVSATSADSATKATLDASGNVITSTYATKTELSGKASTANATQSAAGLMSASDKTKLDGIASGATAVTANTISSWGYTKNTGTVTSITLTAGTGITLNASDAITTNGSRTISADGSAIINSLSEGFSPVTRADYIVAQYAGGGTTTKSYHRKSVANLFAALNKSDITTALGYTPPTSDTTYSVATTSVNGLMSSTDKAKIDRFDSYTTATTVASLNVDYKTIHVTLNANASLSASATGATYNGRSITAYVYTSAARTITIPTSGNYVSMCGSSYTTKAGGWVEFNLTCVGGIWHIAKLEQE